MEAILALDIGTSGAKATLIDREGRSLAKAHAGYPLHVDGDQIEQNPLDWWRAAIDVMKEITAQPVDAAIRAVALTGQMQSVILLEGETVLGQAILYSDTRAKTEMAEILELFGEDSLQKITGNLVDASSILAKLLWLKRNRASDYARATLALLSAHDFISWKLCGARVTDFTNATTTGMLDLEKNAWSEELFNRLDLRFDFLPRLEKAEARIGEISPVMSEMTGVPAGVPVFHGAGDAATATIGSAAGEAGHFYIYLGTSGWLASTGFNQRIDPGTGFWNLRHPDPQRLIFIGPMLTTAGNLEWVNEQFGGLEGKAAPGASTYDAIMLQAGHSETGAGGVMYLPHIAGERCPFRDPSARGVFFGINRQTKRGDLYRAVLEGVALSMRAIREELMKTLEPKPVIRELTLAGGGARSALWAQIFSDVMNCPVNVLSSPEDVGVKGATVIAGKALGWYDSFVAPEAFYAFESRFKPNPAAAERYDRQYAVFRDLYPSLKGVFQKLGQLTENP